MCKCTLQSGYKNVYGATLWYCIVTIENERFEWVTIYSTFNTYDKKIKQFKLGVKFADPSPYYMKRNVHPVM